jgi:hypothetical protein
MAQGSIIECSRMTFPQQGHSIYVAAVLTCDNMHILFTIQALNDNGIRSTCKFSADLVEGLRRFFLGIFLPLHVRQVMQ